MRTDAHYSLNARLVQRLCSVATVGSNYARNSCVLQRLLCYLLASMRLCMIRKSCVQGLVGDLSHWWDK